jgi:hypothetical protein
MGKPAARTLDDFRAAHDPNVMIPQRIRRALAEMLKEHAESWEYEIDFLRRAGIANSLISPFREDFKNHIVDTRGKNPKRVWFADPKVAAKARG